MDAIEEIKARIDIVDYISQTVKLKRSGKNYSGFCPFHDNKRTPAFAVFAESGTWRCFGQCNEGGDIFKFVMKKEGWDFAETLRFLAERAGVRLEPLTPKKAEQEEAHERMRTLLEDAVIYYRHQLTNHPAGKPALDYLHKRGLDDKIIETFEVGYAPSGWSTSLEYFQGKNYTIDELVQAGLLSQREDERVFDRFRNRIMFPIRDERGKMAGFGARILNPDDIPKFLNSPQTALFDKSSLLYGLDKASKAIRLQDRAVIVEGYLDVIAAHQFGFTNVVSPMGTALTEAHVRALKRRTHRIVLALDSDAAGDKATLRGLAVTREAMDRTGEMAFDARGLLRHEARLQGDIRVCSLPEGLDPDEVIYQDPKTWEQLVEEARPVVVHVMETLVKGQDIDDPKVKSQVASQVLPLIEDLPDAIEREAYRQRLARLLRVDERALVSAQPLPRPARARPGEGPRSARPAGPALARRTRKDSIHRQEEHFLGVLLRNPQMVYRLDRFLQDARLPRLSLSDFQDTEHQFLYDIISASLKQDFSLPTDVILGSLPLPLMPLADRLLAQTEKIDALNERLLDDLYITVLRIRDLNLRQSMEHLQLMMEESQSEGTLVDQEYQTTMVRYILAMRVLDQALSQAKNRTAPPA